MKVGYLSMKTTLMLLIAILPAVAQTPTDETGKITVLNVCMPVLRENAASGSLVKLSVRATLDRDSGSGFTVGAYALSQSSAAAPKRRLQRLTPAQLRQFLTCMLRQNVDLRYYGPHLRFQYRIMPPSGSNSSEYLPVVVYDPHRPEGVFLAYEFRRGRCMKFGLGNTGPVIYRHGQPDMLADQLYNGGIGTYKGFVKDMKKVMATPMMEMNVPEIPKTCAICSGLGESQI